MDSREFAQGLMLSLKEKPLSYEDLMAIDSSNLHMECLDHSNRSMIIASHLTVSIQDRDKLKLSLRTKKAAVEKEIRANPENFGIVKITESSVAAEVTTHPDVVSLEEQIIEAQKVVNVLTAASGAMTDRRKMIEKLVDLLQMGYWGSSDPVITNSESKILEEVAVNDLRSKMKQAWKVLEDIPEPE